MNLWNILQEYKDNELEVQAEKNVFNQLIERSEFEEDELELAKYSTHIVENYEYLAYVYNLDLDSYITDVLGQGIDEFYQICYKEGEYQAKKYLLVNAIFCDLGFEIADNKYKDVCDTMGYVYEDAKNNKSQNAQIVYSIMEQEVLSYLGIKR